MLQATVWLTLAFVRAHFYFLHRAQRALALNEEQALSSKERRRLQHYFYGTTYLSVIFCALRGRTRRRREKYLFTNLAALAYFFDDLADKLTDGFERNEPERYGRAADGRGIALHLLDRVYAGLPGQHLPQFKDFLHRVFNLEAAGRQQRQPVPDLAALQTLTAEKGGYSVLLFRRLLDHELLPAEQAALYQFGFLLQLCDDVFDVWFDRGSGTATAATVLLEAGQGEALTALFEDQVAATARAFRRLPFRRTGREVSLCAVHFIVAITRVCLRRYLKLQQKHGTLPLDRREAMVVDMERWPNRWQAALFLLRPIDR